MVTYFNSQVRILGIFRQNFLSTRSFRLVLIHVCQFVVVVVVLVSLRVSQSQYFSCNFQYCSCNFSTFRAILVVFQQFQYCSCNSTQYFFFQQFQCSCCNSSSFLILLVIFAAVKHRFAQFVSNMLLQFNQIF